MKPETRRKKGNYNNTYWDGNGKYKAESDTVRERIPREGRAATMELNLYRVMANYYYDLYNNGLCNRENKWPSVQYFLNDFKEELVATGEPTYEHLRIVLHATEEEAERLEQKLIDAFEWTMNGCILVAYNSIKPGSQP